MSAIGDFLYGTNPKIDPNATRLEGRDVLDTDLANVGGTRYGRQVQADRFGLARQLRAVAAGDAAGAGEMAAARAGDRAIAAQRSLAAGARGFGAGAGGAAAQRAVAMAAGDAAGNASQAALADQQNARAMQAAVLQGMTQDQLAALGQTGALRQAELGARTQQEMARLGQPGRPGAIQIGAQLAGAALLSDERVKEDVGDGAADVREILRGLNAHTYRYKREVGGDGSQHVGIMAQDLEKTPAGRSMVREVRGVKHVDVAKLAGALAAAAADTEARVTALEGGRTA